jgi:hypothetical protein
MTYPYLSEKVAGSGIELSAMMWLLFLVLIVWWWWGLLNKESPRVQAQRIAQMTLVAHGEQQAAQGGFLYTDGQTPTPELTVTPVALTATPTPTFLPTMEIGYSKVTIVARFSNYWPPLGGTNCFNDCEHFTDGERVDQAMAENWRVVACPQELLLGTRIEYPPDSGVIWICRDRGDEIYFYFSEAELPIYWLDFMSEIAWVDYGSYIQVQVYVPNDQLEMMP